MLSHSIINCINGHNLFHHKLSTIPSKPRIVVFSMKKKRLYLIYFVPDHITYHKSLTVSAKDLCCPWNAQQSPSINKIMVDENDSFIDVA